MVTEEMILIIEDAEKHLSAITGVKVKLSLSFERNEFANRGYEFRSPDFSDRDFLMELVCKNFGIKNILNSRTRNYAEARFAFSFLARKHLGMMVTEIAEFLHRDHTTIVSAISRANELLKLPRDPFGKRVEHIESNFLNSKTKTNDNHNENRTEGLGEG